MDTVCLPTVRIGVSSVFVVFLSATLHEEKLVSRLATQKTRIGFFIRNV
jgi:hypothetical protein